MELAIGDAVGAHYFALTDHKIMQKDWVLGKKDNKEGMKLAKAGDWQAAHDAWAALPAYVAGAIGYSAIFIPVGYLFSRAILVGLAYVFIWEGILTTLISGIAASPWNPNPCAAQSRTVGE